jgi:hypothetical protein
MKALKLNLFMNELFKSFNYSLMEKIIKSGCPEINEELMMNLMVDAA